VRALYQHSGNALNHSATFRAEGYRKPDMLQPFD
jgi:hypothetical protein